MLFLGYYIYPGPFIVKGAKSLVDHDYNKNFTSTTLKKSPIIIYNELFVHILGFCLFIHEIDIVKIWSHFMMLLESFVIYKTLVDKVLLRTIKFDCTFCYSNVHQMF